MAYVVDTNVLLRSLQPHLAAYQDAVDAVAALFQAGEKIFLLPQVVVGFWSVCTRRVANNGLGLTPAQTETEVKKVEGLLSILPESPSVYAEWRQLVVMHGVSGVEVHDARIVAAILEIREPFGFGRNAFAALKSGAGEQAFCGARAGESRREPG